MRHETIPKPPSRHIKFVEAPSSALENYGLADSSPVVDCQLRFSSTNSPGIINRHPEYLILLALFLVAGTTSALISLT